MINISYHEHWIDRRKCSCVLQTFIFVKGTIIITRAILDLTVTQVDEMNKQAIFEIHTLYTDCISIINNIQVRQALQKYSYSDVFSVFWSILMYSLIKDGDSYSETSKGSRQYYR